MVPEGADFVLSQPLRPLSPLARRPADADVSVHVHSFDVDYREDGSVGQFNSDLAVGGGPDGASPRTRKTISVNDPLRFHVRYYILTVPCTLCRCWPNDTAGSSSV